MVESGSVMKPDMEVLARMRERFPAPAKAKVTLEPGTVVGGAFDDLYECLICKDVAWDAKTCRACERIFCLTCLNTWREKSRNCPGCKKNDFVPETPGLPARRYLDRLKFKCNACQQEYDYNRASEHQTVCSAPKIACYLECSN